MKRSLVFLATVLLFASMFGCQKKHPVKLNIGPAMKAGTITTIAVFPFTSAIHHADDPDKVAPKMVEKVFFEELELRSDYKFVTPNTIEYAVQVNGLESANEKFLQAWPKKQTPDMEFLTALTDVLKCDAFMIGTVDVWQKDEADFQETATPATYVGATITCINSKTGEIVFLASDENYLEGARTVKEERQVVTGASGNVYKDLGEKMYKAPPFEDVVPTVVKALVRSLPRR
jgi:hypothetical protein